MLRKRSGCLRTNRTIQRQCQSVRRVRKRRSVTAACAWRDGRLRDVPALPAGLRGPVAEVDVLAVEAEALVEAAELVEHLAAQEEEGGEHPVGLDRLGRPVLEQVVVELPGLRAEDRAQRRPPDDRAADRREAAARGLPAAVREEQLRADHARPRMDLGELERAARPRPAAARCPGSRRRRTGRSSRRCPVFALAANPSAFVVDDQPARRPSGAGGFATTTSSSTCGASASRQRSSSGCGPCVTTTASTPTLTGALGRPRASGAPSRPS